MLVPNAAGCGARYTLCSHILQQLFGKSPLYPPSTLSTKPPRVPVNRHLEGHPAGEPIEKRLDVLS